MLTFHPNPAPADPPVPPPSAAEQTGVTGRRVVAYLVDWILYALMLVWAFITLATHTTWDTMRTSTLELHLAWGQDAWQLTGLDVVLFLLGAYALWCLPRAALHARFGQTIGKLLAGIRVTGPDGRNPSLRRALARELTWPLDGFPYLLPGLAGLLTILGSRQHRRLGDHLANTHVTTALPTRTRPVERPATTVGAVAAT